MVVDVDGFSDIYGVAFDGHWQVAFSMGSAFAVMDIMSIYEGLGMNIHNEINSYLNIHSELMFHL